MNGSNHRLPVYYLLFLLTNGLLVSFSWAASTVEFSTVATFNKNSNDGHKVESTTPTNLPSVPWINFWQSIPVNQTQTTQNVSSLGSQPPNQAPQNGQQTVQTRILHYYPGEMQPKHHQRQVTVSLKPVFTGTTNQQHKQSHKSGPTPVSQFGANVQNIVINPADIQFSVPDVPDTVGQKIIEQIRAQLGTKPITLSELNNLFVNFNTELPGVLVNRTTLTKFEEQTSVEHNKSIRTAAAASNYNNHKPSQPSYSQPIPTTYNPATEAPKQPYVVHTYQNPPIVSKPYNPGAQESGPTAYAAPKPKPQSQQYNQYQKSSEQQYQYTIPQYHENQQQYPQVIYKYIEVCSNPPKTSYTTTSDSPTLPPYLANLGVDLSKLNYDSQKSASDSYSKLSTVYAQIQDKMSQLEGLKNYVKSLESQAQSYLDSPLSAAQAYVQLPQVNAYGYSPVVASQAAPAYTGQQQQSSGYSNYQQSQSPPTTYTTVSQATPPKYQQQQKSTQQSYSQSSYSNNKKQPENGYNPVTMQLNYPQDGNKVKISYHKVEESIKTNKTQTGYH